jgi:serine/threonine protein kinase
MATLLNIESGRIATVATFYKVLELLGVGRYSEVYRAFDTQSQSDVALKLYVRSDGKSHELAKSEAGLLSHLRDLNSEYFPALRKSVKQRINNQNHPLLVLELGAYLGEDGHKSVISLKDVIPQADGHGPVTQMPEEFWCLNAVLHWILHMVQAVKQLHSIALVHRDIKPANILLKRGPGQSKPVPFLLDFNSASNTADLEVGSGTPRYLPPEVMVRRRMSPSPADDLWAIAAVAWELLFGQASSPEKRTSPHGLLKGAIPEGLAAVLCRALSVKPEARYSTADEMLAAFEACLPEAGEDGIGLTSDQMARARMQMDRIRRTIGQTLAPPGQIFVPKEVDDAVTTVFAWLSKEDSQALNLVEEIVNLGPAAIPACLQQGYRLQRTAESYEEIVVALGKLGADHLSLAQRSIDAAASSSNRGVRELCWRLCAALGYFPEASLRHLTADEGLLLPDERLALADLCIRFSTDETATAALLSYMSREYVLDKRRYFALRDNVARRVSEVRKQNTAKEIWDACHKRIWRLLREFEAIPLSTRQECEGGLVELFADAFAATGGSCLAVLRMRKGAQRSIDPNGLQIFRRFAVKAGRSDPEVRDWVIKEATRFPEDRELQFAAEKLAQRKKPRQADPAELLKQYLSGEAAVFNELRFWKTEEVLKSVRTRLSGRLSTRELDLILKLLRGYQGRQHINVVQVVLDHWTKLAGHDYKATTEVLCSYSVSPKQREKATAILDGDLGGIHDATARWALEQLLR